MFSSKHQKNPGLPFLLLLPIGLLCLLLLAFRSDTTLQGTVVSAKNEPLPGVLIRVANAQKTFDALTDAQGKYRLSIPAGRYELTATYVGYETHKILAVEVPEGKQTTVDLLLSESAVGLSELVISSEPVKTMGSTSRIEAEDSVLHSVESGFVKAPPASAKPAKSAGVKKMSAKELPASKAAKPERVFDEKAVGRREAKREAPAPAEKTAEGLDFDMAKDMTVNGKMEERPKEHPDPAPGRPAPPSLRAGLLTAGEWNDLHNWSRHWADMLADGETDAFQKQYGFFPRHRYPVLLTNEQGVPLIDVPVQLRTRGGTVIWETRTDNNGKAELWDGLFDAKKTDDLEVAALLDGRMELLGAPVAAAKGFLHKTLRQPCKAPTNADVVWVVDATGSMGDEIEYLKTELYDVIGRVKARNPDLSLRMGTVFYRDKGDEYLVRASALTPDIGKTVEYIGKQAAGGGGDYPEAVHSALEEAVFNQPWSPNALARICFLVLDASPHQDPAVVASLQKSIREAARRGIRIVPVAASGIQKDTEFLMKFFDLATNGTYVFLTDHSGIGGKHLEPTTDEYKVEMFNDLLVRLITDYLATENCDGKVAIRSEPVAPNDDPQAQKTGQPWQAFFYPNPATTSLTLELPEGVQAVALYDSEGKSVHRFEKPGAGIQAISVANLPAGFYTVRIQKNNQWQSGKLMVVRT